MPSSGGSSLARRASEVGGTVTPAARREARRCQPSTTRRGAARRTRVQAARDLVPDRACGPGVLLDQDAVAQERHGRPALDRSWSLDRDHVHRDGTDDRAHARPRRAPPCRSCRGETHPRTRPGRGRSRSGRPRRTDARSRCSHPAPSCLAPATSDSQRSAGAGPSGRVVPERGDPVDRDPAARGVETCTSGARGPLRCSRRAARAADTARSPRRKRSSCSSVKPRSASASAKWLISPDDVTARGAPAPTAPSGPSRCRA